MATTFSPAMEAAIADVARALAADPKLTVIRAATRVAAERGFMTFEITRAYEIRQKEGAR